MIVKLNVESNRTFYLQKIIDSQTHLSPNRFANFNLLIRHIECFIYLRRDGRIKNRLFRINPFSMRTFKLISGERVQKDLNQGNHPYGIKQKATT